MWFRGIKVVLASICALIALIFLYFIWAYIDRDRIPGPTSPQGIVITLEVADLHGPIPDYTAILELRTTGWDSFVYDIGALGSRKKVEDVVRSMQWVNSTTLLFTNTVTKKEVQIAYVNDLWSLREQRLNDKE